MPVGTCPLCLLEKEKQDSHLIPASMYRIIFESQTSPPVVINAKKIFTSSRQVTAHELCWDCEQLFSRRGEDYMAGQVFQGDHFPLLNRLKYALPDWEFASHSAYSGVACGVDTDAILYFGASVLWRASLRQWTIGNGLTTTLDLGTHRETLRQYLHEESGFPVGAVIVTVCTDFASQGCFFTPTRIREGVIEGISVNLLGVYYRFFFEPGVPEDFYRFSIVHNERRRIIVANHEKESMHSWGHLKQTAKESEGLKALSRAV